ncbi:MAG: hypothetical protein M3Y56_11530, partial [Armatimonadota bacterium]|nr:hypothetical protein [Armatimonadota bacterium]
PGPGAPIRIYAPTQPATFPNPKEWDADMKALAAAAPVPPLSTALPGLSWTGRLGLDAPRSPLSIFAVNMSAGMSSAFRFASDHLTGFQGTPEEYASHLAGLGFDRVFEKVRDDLLRDNAKDYDRWFSAMAAHGMQAGVNVEGPVGQAGMLGSPNLAFYSYNLPEWHAPLFRDYQLVAEHFNQYPNFAGIFTGADNAGYVPYWDWAPPIPNRPWAKAFAEWMRGQPLQTPVGPAINPAKDYEVRGTQAQFIDYIHRYDETFRQYGYFARAVQEVDPRLEFTIGSFGSSPGVGGRGGWPWATIPGEPLFDGLPIQTAYDWNETEFTKPMHNVALVDRLRSYYPTKPTWSIIDNFGLFLGREAMQRNYALTLTRGVEGVGTNSIPHTTGREDTPGLNGPKDREKIVAAETELHAWIHKYGGIYAGTKPQASIGILYVHDQAISRPILADPHDTRVYSGSHEGKTTEALFLCHAAGWPARIITPEEMQRKFIPRPAQAMVNGKLVPFMGFSRGPRGSFSRQVILLTGLNRFDNTWNWYAGLEPALRNFVDGGGRILLDDESVCPVAATKTGMHIAAYIPQGVDFAPLLFDRNRDNFTKLNAAMQGIAKPPVLSHDPTIWPVVSETRGVQYITVVNWGYVAGQNASKVVKPQTGHLTWSTSRPIYDVPGVGDPRPWGSRISLAVAGTVDLTHNAFHVYALPSSPVTPPAIAFSPRVDSFYGVNVSTGAGHIGGVPVSLTVTRGGETITIYGATGADIKLPIRTGDTGEISITATELLSGLKSAAFIYSMPGRMQRMDELSRRMAMDRVQFAGRRTVPLVVALTPAQAQDTTLHDLVERIVRHFRGQGRPVTVDTIEPGHVVRSLQVQKPIQRFPQWQTVAADLVLLGAPQNNLLLMDQARGYLLPDTIVRPTYRVTHSPFVGEYQALNLLANDPAGLEVAARMVG